MTFEQWRQVWQAAGKWKSDLRGPVSKWYVMCRLKDAGAYEQGNVYIGTKRQNCKDMNMYARKK